MSKAAPLQTAKSQPLQTADANLILQRKCARGAGASSLTGECALGLQTKLKVNEPGDIYEQEADRIADQVMAAPAHHSVSGVPPRIQRLVGQPTGQVDAAPASVDQALASPDRPLEPALRQDMEQRFGHDFSRVRVHSGAAAEQSTRDVQALAYTVGHNLVFGSGRFAPGTYEGRRLIAHELTHVVQQSGSEGIRLDQSDEKRGLSPIPTLARKAEVDLPGWGSPGVGDDDSDVTFTPSGDFRTKDFQRDMAKLAKADPLAQFYKKQQALKAGEWVHSEMEEEKGYSGTLQIKAGSKGTVEISVKAHFYFDEKWDSRYDQIFACSWVVEADLKGKLKFISKGRPHIEPIGDDEAPFQLARDLNADETENQNSGSVQISPAFISNQFTDIPNVTIGQQSESGKSGGISLGNEQTFQPGTIQPTFYLNLEVIDIPPPTGEVIIGPIHMRNSRRVLFPAPKKRKGQDTVSGAQREGLIFWYRHLNDETKTQIEAGAIPISLEGHASTTGDAGENLRLSSRRVEHVKEILSMFVGNRAVFEFRSLGEYETKTQDEVESEEERALIVSVLEQTFEGESTP